VRRAIFEWVVRYKPTSSMAAVCPALRWALQRKASIDRKNLRLTVATALRVGTRSAWADATHSASGEAPRLSHGRWPAP